MTARLNINVTDADAAWLRAAAARDETSVTEVVRRAVGVYDHIDCAVHAGKTVQIVGPHDVTTLAVLR